MFSEEAKLFTVQEDVYTRIYSFAASLNMCLLAPFVLLGGLFFAIFGGAGILIFPAELIFSYIN